MQHLRKRHWTSSLYITIPLHIGITAAMLLATLSYAWLRQIMLGCSERIIDGNIFIVIIVTLCTWLGVGEYIKEVRESEHNKHKRIGAD